MSDWGHKYRAEGFSRADLVRAERVASVQQAARHIAAGTRVLEAGSGTGRLSIALARLHAVDVTGVDNSCEAIATGERLLKESGALAGSVRFVKADMYELPFDAGTFDLVLSDSVIEHLDRPEAALAELARVTRSGGILVVAAPNRLRPDGWDLYRALARPPYLQKSFTPRALRRLITGVGFIPVTTFGDEVWLERNLALLRGRLRPGRPGTTTPGPASGDSLAASARVRSMLRPRLDALLPAGLHVNVGVVARRS
jgi:SAM-dependent methyltransferase